ncbi:hypothetical protein, variant [Saprolegnia diclina VS20]|nr:hypothetical protein, variant [Saprolegnia diclina VS20]EQC32946.1 hypothetical protein, variant [Saprolegnia diclina VS20]|eukprot:XP_008613632.1 hypothetical protein, variant [Saprolegnia diclina VS20]
MIETLSVRIAQCTRKNEHLKRAKTSFDEALNAMAREKADVEEAFARAVASAADEAARLKNDLHRSQLSANMAQDALQQLRVELQELQRHAERDASLAAQRDEVAMQQQRALQCQLAAATSQWDSERSSLLAQLEAVRAELNELQAKAASQANVDEQLELARTANHQLQRDLMAARADEDSAREDLRAMSEKKLALDAKVQALLKMVRDEHARTAEVSATVKAQADRVTHLASTEVSLQKECAEWKAKYKQTNAHINKLTIKLAHEEKAKVDAVAALQETKTAFEAAERRCVDHLFQLKQAQEQCKYLASVKTSAPSNPMTDAVASHPESDAPSWMRD